MKFVPLCMIIGCAIASPAGGQRPADNRPLAKLASEHMLVLPVQYLAFVDSLGWSGSVPSSSGYLAELDDEITFALAERGLGTRWKFPSDVERSAARNPGYAPDPHGLSARQLRYGMKLDPWQLAEPLASQLRALAALSDSRYVLLPVEVRLTGGRRTGRAMLHVVVIDARRAQVQWAGDVAGMQTATFSPSIAADLASRLADLVAAQDN